MLDIKEEILSFDISNNQDFLAYSIKRNFSKDDEFVLNDDEFSAAGDTLLIRNLKNYSEFELYFIKIQKICKFVAFYFLMMTRNCFFQTIEFG